MRIGLIGAGRAGSALAKALTQSGQAVAAVADQVPSRATALAGAIGAEVMAAKDVSERADLILLAVPDGAIAETARELAAVSAGLEGRCYYHLSGAHPAALLAPLRRTGTIGSLHPLLSLAGTDEDAIRLRGCYFALEGEERAVRIARELVVKLGGRILELRPEDKPLYHAAAVIASNYLVALVDTALGLYEHLGLDREAGRLAIWPLLESTMANIGTLGPEAALTGPISRGDLDTVQSHLQILGDDSPASQVYAALGRAALVLAERAGRLEPERAAAMDRLLSGGLDHVRR